MSIVYIGFGSNLGDRKKNIEQALRLLKQHPQIEIKKISSLVESKAVTLDDKPQPDYLNGALQIATDLDPFALLGELKKIETALGRKPEEKRWQPRPIDLDILLYDDRTLQTATLTIPHPRIQERPFVLEPLREIGKNVTRGL